MTTTIDKILEKAAALEAQAAALRLAATLLNGDAHRQKRATVKRTVDQAIAVRRAQRNGHGEAAALGPAARARQATVARREEKAQQVVSIVKAYGKPMPIRLLREAARARGITSLTGIISYVRSGYLVKSGRKGKSRYAFRQLPPSASAPPA
jgi:hypothetical protein